MKRSELLSLLLTAGIAPLLLGETTARAADEPLVLKDLAYQSGEGADPVRHRLDLYLPKGKKVFPVLFFVHGGAWRSGTKELYRPLARTFVDRGIGVAVANYRLSPAVQHPEHIRDVAKAFAWVSAHAREHDADPGRLYVMGHSAGAHLVALLALDPRYLKAEGLSSAAIKGVIGVSGPYALGATGFENVFGMDDAKRKDAFPLTHVGDLEAKAIPPFLLQAGDADYPGLLPVSRLLEGALQGRGVKVRCEEIAQRDHISIITRMAQADDPAVKQIIEFVAP